MRCCAFFLSFLSQRTKTGEPVFKDGKVVELTSHTLNPGGGHRASNVAAACIAGERSAATR